MAVAAPVALSQAEGARLVAGSDLRFGSSGENVSLLQRFLATQTIGGDAVYPEGIVSGYFGSLTKRGVARFQVAYHIVPAVGYFGPKTKAAIASVLHLQNASNQSTLLTPQWGGVDNKNQPSVSPGGASGLTATSLLPFISNQDVAVATGTESLYAYQTSVVASLKNISFVSLDDVGILQNASGTVETIPTILNNLQTAIKNNDSAGQSLALKKLKIWSGFYGRLYGGLSSLPAGSNILSYHKTILAWMLYNETMIGAVLSQPTTQENVAVAIYNYQRAFNAYWPSYQKIFSAQQISENPKIWSPVAFLWRVLSPFLNVFAQTNGVLPFGGRIEDIADECTTGELLVIGETPPPSSGAFFLYWWVYAANPFLYDAVYPSNSILGVQFPDPGVCNKGMATYPEGEGTILYFGTSLSPYVPGK